MTIAVMVLRLGVLSTFCFYDKSPRALPSRFAVGEVTHRFAPGTLLGRSLSWGGILKKCIVLGFPSEKTRLTGGRNPKTIAFFFGAGGKQLLFSPVVEKKCSSCAAREFF